MVDKMVEYIASNFAITMLEEGFKNFAEMKECYWWDTDDIKDEMMSISNSAPQFGYLCDDDCSFVYDDELVSYRSFSKMVINRSNKILNALK